MQIYLMPDGSKRQYEKAPEGAVLYNPKAKKEEPSIKEKTVKEPQNKAIKPQNKAVKGNKRK